MAALVFGVGDEPLDYVRFIPADQLTLFAGFEPFRALALPNVLAHAVEFFDKREFEDNNFLTMELSILVVQNKRKEIIPA